MTLNIYGTVGPGDVYDLDEWTKWLQGHGVDIRDVQRIRFSGRRMTIYRYAVDALGRKFLRRNKAIAMRRPARRAVLSAPPLWTSR